MIQDDQSKIQNYSTNERQHVLYYRSIQRDIQPSFIQYLQEVTGIIIDTCKSWQELMLRLSIISTLDLPTPLILVDKEMFNQQDATISEIITMISTLHKCNSISIKMRLAVVVELACDLNMIKKLREHDIAGIVPCSAIYGRDIMTESLKQIIAGKKYWPKEIIDLVTRSSANKIPTKPGIVLTSRQTQVLALVCNRGLSNKKIAQALKISESTVKVHISAILREYGVQNRTQLVLAAGSGLTAGPGLTAGTTTDV